MGKLKSSKNLQTNAMADTEMGEREAEVAPLGSGDESDDQFADATAYIAGKDCSFWNVGFGRAFCAVHETASQSD